MSKRSNKCDKYNRSEQTEYWMQIVNKQDDEFDGYWADEPEWDVYYYQSMYDGYPQSMEELVNMRLTTLLRSLRINSAKDLAQEWCW